MVDTECYLAVADVVQVLGFGGGLVNVVDVAVGWVVKLIEELEYYALGMLENKYTVSKLNILKKLSAE